MSIAALPASSPWRGQARRCYRHYGVGPSHLSSERACRLKPAGLSLLRRAPRRRGRRGPIRAATGIGRSCRLRYPWARL